nr:manganese-binding transcriptional regulator MntR [uncultured Lichenicoccus sp.]
MTTVPKGQQEGRQDGQDTERARQFRGAREAQARVLLEDYVELIADLLHEQGDPAASIGPSRIARRLGVSHASAIKCIGRLCRTGLAESRPYRGVTLTPSGQALARAVRRRHRIVLETLERLGVPADLARADAEGIEHHVSPATLDALERFLAADAPIRP